MQALTEKTHAGVGRLADRVAIITGAGSGIGAAICERFAAEGANVVAVDVNAAGLKIYGGRDDVVVCKADVTGQADVDRMIEQAIGAFGRLDVLVNNAGVMDAFLPVGEVTDEVWQHVLAVNLTGPMMLTRAAVRHMLANGGGSIVNIASIGGFAGARAGVAYTASKHGVIGLTRNTAAVYAKDSIRCNAICPGAVDTGISLGGEPSGKGYEALNRTLSANPRLGRPEEIAAVAAFLACDDASFVTGAVLVADGGWTAV